VSRAGHDAYFLNCRRIKSVFLNGLVSLDDATEVDDSFAMIKFFAATMKRIFSPRHLMVSWLRKLRSGAKCTAGQTVCRLKYLDGVGDDSQFSDPSFPAEIQLYLLSPTSADVKRRNPNDSQPFTPEAIHGHVYDQTYDYLSDPLFQPPFTIPQKIP
jgi:hypothetical protein